MADLDEAFGQHVENEASKKLMSRQGDGVGAVSAKGDAAMVEGDEAIVADADAMGVPPEVVEELSLIAKGGLLLDDPPDLLESVAQGERVVRLGVRSAGPVKSEMPGTADHESRCGGPRSPYEIRARDCAECGCIRTALGRVLQHDIAPWKPLAATHSRYR